jgi:hypothetical protein
VAKAPKPCNLKKAGRKNCDSKPFFTDDFLLLKDRPLSPMVLHRHTVLPTSSATNSAPCLSIRTPTGRPRAWPLSLRKAVNTSSGLPEGFPLANGTKITL